MNEMRMKIMDLNFNDLKLDLSAANSALRVSAIADEMEKNQRMISEINRQSAKRNATLMAGAEASVAQKELLEQQLEIIQKQNELLYDNYDKLKEMFNAQVNANQETKAELKQSKRFNAWMMVIAIIAMLAAIAGPIATIWVSL